jgi:hypothetical protein
MSSLVFPQSIVPVHEGFRELELPKAFMWEAGILETALNGLYVVAFLSTRNLEAPQAMVDRLLELDHDAFEEAQTMPGFHTYWHDDDLSPEGKGLSFCLWDTKEDAQYAAARPKHLEAVRYARGEGREVYRKYELDKRNIFRFGASKIMFEMVA